jgi:hypothetical protein
MSGRKERKEIETKKNELGQARYLPKCGSVVFIVNNNNLRANIASLGCRWFILLTSFVLLDRINFFSCIACNNFVLCILLFGRIHTQLTRNEKMNGFSTELPARTGRRFSLSLVDTDLHT